MSQVPGPSTALGLERLRSCVVGWLALDAIRPAATMAMGTVMTAGSKYQTIADWVDGLPVRSFLRPADLPPLADADPAAALQAMCLDGRLVRVRRGLYWKGAVHAGRMSSPPPLTLGLALAGPGAGTASVAAAADLGLTTQCPSVTLVAVPGRRIAPLPAVVDSAGRRVGSPNSVVFLTRPPSRALMPLTRAEATVLEVLRDGLRSAEASWDEAASVVDAMASRGEVRPDVLLAQAFSERPRCPREFLSQLFGHSPA